MYGLLSVYPGSITLTSRSEKLHRQHFREKWDVPVIYADGLDDFMNVDTLPTVLVLGRNDEIIYRAKGLASEGFPESLVAAIQTAISAAP